MTKLQQQYDKARSLSILTPETITSTTTDLIIEALGEHALNIVDLSETIRVLLSVNNNEKQQQQQ